MENGFGDYDKVEEDGSIHDPYRIEYLKKHIEKMKLAVDEDGVDLSHSKKDSFYWYKDVIAVNGERL